MDPLFNQRILPANYEASPLAASKALLVACDKCAIEELLTLGLKPNLEEHQHWTDIIFSIPNVDWIQTGKLVLFLFDHVKAVSDSGLPFPTAEELTQIAASKFSKYFDQAGDFGSKFIFEYMSAPCEPSKRLLAGFAPSIIPDYFACNLNSIELNPENKETIVSNINTIRPFFALLKMVAETLPEHFEEIFQGIKTDVLEHKSIMASREDHNGSWIQMIYFGMLVNLHQQSFEVLQEICIDRKVAGSVYTLYKSLYLNELQNDFQQACTHKDIIFDLPAREQKKLGDIIQHVNESAVEIFKFYLENPKLIPLLEKIAKSNVEEFQKQQAIISFVQHLTNGSPDLQNLILAASTDPKKLIAILNPEFLCNLSSATADFCNKVHAFLLLSKDPALYSPLIVAIENDEQDRASIMLAGIKFINKPGDLANHSKRITYVERIAHLSESDLPNVIDENFVFQIISHKSPKNLNGSNESECFSKSKRKLFNFTDSSLNSIYNRFQALKSGRLFIDLVNSFGEKSKSVLKAVEHIEKHLENDFYRSFLNDPELRRNYFQSILVNSDFQQEFEERMVLNRSQKVNTKSEVELFKKWFQSKIQESKLPPTNGSVLQTESEEPSNITSHFRPPPPFNRIVIVAPTEKIRLDLIRIRATIPSLSPNMIQIINSEMRTPLLDTARHLKPDRLMLFMASNCSHSTYYSLLANIPDSRRNNLYKFYGVGALNKLLGELDSWKKIFDDIETNKI